MNTEHLTAFRASPPFFFGLYEMPYAEISYALKIANHAHAVLGSITLIQMVQPDAREAVTTEAILDFSVHYLLTAFNSTYDAGFRFEAVVTPATRAWFPVSRECAAERQFIPEGVISFVKIAVAVVDLL